MESEKSSNQQPFGRSAPRDLLQPWVLLLLRNWSAHGYALSKALAEHGFHNIDQSALYRELRAMEQKGWLSSAWDTSQNGPARRTYRLTAAGEDILRAWASDLERYQRMVTGFFTTYADAWDSFARGTVDRHDNDRATKRSRPGKSSDSGKE